MRRGALAGIAAAATWAALEPPLGRLLRTPYSDVRLLGAPITTGRLWPVAGLAVHLGNGAVFGAEGAGLFARAMLHEYDHLTGKLLVDFVGPLKKRQIKRKLEKEAGGHVHGEHCDHDHEHGHDAPAGRSGV